MDPASAFRAASITVMHIWSDYIYAEIVDPETGETLPDGEAGELVLTTLRKQGAPLIRYRTHDLTRIIPGDCPCGLKHPRIDTLTGRTDDMVKVKGFNMFPAQIEEVIKFVDGTSSEYQVINVEAINGRDVLTVLFETPLEGDEKTRCEEQLAAIFKAKIGCTPEAKGVPMGELPAFREKDETHLRQPLLSRSYIFIRRLRYRSCFLWTHAACF